MTSKIIYEGDLHTSATHLQSGNTIATDAPIDNNGKGACFSPTDLVATALGSCMLTMMGIVANTQQINITGSSCDIEKIMTTNPRRISRVIVTLNIIGQEHYSDKERTILKKTAMTCPVIESLHPEITKTVSFSWNGINED